MDPIANPYSPGAGRRPPELAGREGELRGFEVLVARCEAGAPDRGWVLHGLRGVGKTVLLNELFAAVSARGWFAIKVEASYGQALIPRVTQGLHRMLRDASGRHEPRRLLRLLRVFRSFSLRVDPGGSYTFGVDIEPLAGTADTGNLSVDLAELFTELGRTAADLGVGAALLIDEMQDTNVAELRALNVAVHETGQGAAPLPLIVVGAGLPSLPGLLSEATSYAERLYEYRPIGRLSEAAARAALERPAQALGVEWSPGALDLALAGSQGYPFFVQAFGKHIWDWAITSPISVDDARLGVTRGRAEVEAGLYLARWLRATPAQRQLLRAVAGAGEGAAMGTNDVARALGRTRSDISVPRDQLLKKGLLYVPERGLVAFTVPGMAEFVLRQDDP